MEQIELKKVKKDEFIRFTEDGPVWIRGYYEPSCKKYQVYKFDDVNHEIFLKGTRKVYVGFTF